MFGELVIAYLFLAGVGAGGVGYASLADLLYVRDPFGPAAPDGMANRRGASCLAGYVLAASLGALVLGSVCLLLDLGRIDRVLSLFAAWPPTLMTVGAWAIALLTAVTALLMAVRFLYLPDVGRRVVAAAEVLAAILSVVVAVYAGLLLSSLAGVHLWSTAWVPVLFALSAASCGCALPLVVLLFVEDDGTLGLLVRASMRVDAVVIVAEAVAAALFIGFVLGSPHPGVQASAGSLMGGEAAAPWWVGFVLCGLALPLAAEAACALRWRRRGAAPWLPTSVAVALVGVLVLAGAMGLRAAVVEAGAQRPLELQEPASADVIPPALPAQDTEGKDVAPWSS